MIVIYITYSSIWNSGKKLMLWIRRTLVSWHVLMDQILSNLWLQRTLWNVNFWYRYRIWGLPLHKSVYWNFKTGGKKGVGGGWKRWGCYFWWLSKSTHFQVFERQIDFPIIYIGQIWKLLPRMNIHVYDKISKKSLEDV